MDTDIPPQNTLAPLKEGVYVVGEHRAVLGTQLRRHYDAGLKIHAIAREIRRSYGFVHRLLAEAGTQFRPRGGAHTRRPTHHAGGTR
jgi:hypothetical protein